MTGIAAAAWIDDTPAPDIQRAVAAMRHSDAETACEWAGSGVCLGQGTATRPPDAQSLRWPQCAKLEHLVIAANARIYNLHQLMAELDLPAAAGANAGLLLARAYLRWQTDAPKHVDGDFAFAVWDSRARRLFCATDHAGIRPLYFWHSPDGLLFIASQLNGLIALGAPRRLDEGRACEYLLGLDSRISRTFYRDLCRLPPAHWLSWQDGRLQIEPYWALDPTRRLELASNSAYADAFRAAFTAAVKTRMADDTPTGVLLSGGLDSSSIVSVAEAQAAETGRTLHTFSVVYDEFSECDERPYIRAVLRDRHAITPHFMLADHLTPWSKLAELFAAGDGPQLSPNLSSVWSLFGQVAEQGVRVLFDGYDGDGTVSHGWNRVAELVRSGQWLQLLRLARALAPHGVPLRDLLWRCGVRPLLPAGMLRGARVGRRCLGRHPERVLRPETLRRLGVHDTLHRLPGPIRTEQEAHFRWLTSPLRVRIVEEVQRIAAAWGLERRFPFLDHRLQALCLALPAEQKLRGGFSRMIMREALADELAPEIRARQTKTYLASHYLHSLASAEDRWQRLFSRRPHCLAEYVNWPKLEQLYRPARRSPSLDNYLMLWRVSILGEWLGFSRLEA